ncbi:13564_t:CDS:2 [Entrophospora sp. SA101]|nr:13564_t:CDS:2 [Entrophospora sp. SA101]CAJ0845720.1 3183_t:CDS:2 [Entrophospora sp. SA101]CAJ0886578.1 5425_t:CDS:2 [Entrophospora sp. SA101]CAJ0919654.1 18270_t:CDS:2 [Entrophospora sp. SA101]
MKEKGGLPDLSVNLPNSRFPKYPQSRKGNLSQNSSTVKCFLSAEEWAFSRQKKNSEGSLEAKLVLISQLTDHAIGIALVQNLPIAIIFLSATDIAKFVEGNADLGITGQDMVAESLMSEKVEEIIELEFGKCKLQTQAPVRKQIKDVKELRKELLEKKLKLSTLVASCVLGLAGAIGVVAAKKYVLVDYNIERINLKQAAKITPGRQALMISLLEDVNWIEVQSMVCREEVANVMDKLEEIGATDILVFNLIIVESNV